LNETDCLDDAPTERTLTALNRLIRELAPVLNRPSVINGVSVRVSGTGGRVDLMLKRQADATYVFAVEMNGQATTVTFELARVSAAATAQVLDENRTIEVAEGAFTDEFPAYGARVYRVVPR
jgi:hypothetical protein